MKVNNYKYKYRGTDRFGYKWDEYYDRVSGEYIEPKVDFDTLVNKVLTNCNEHKHWEILKGQYVVRNAIRTTIGFEYIVVLDSDGNSLPDDALDHEELIELGEKIAKAVEQQPEEMENEHLYQKLVAEEKKKFREPNTTYLADMIGDDLDEEDSAFIDSMFESVYKKSL